MFFFQIFKQFGLLFSWSRTRESNRIIVENDELNQNDLSCNNHILTNNPDKNALVFKDDICAELRCEKIDGHWNLDLTAIRGIKCKELLGRNYNANEKLALSELMDAHKFEIHQRLVSEVLDVGPQAHNWTILFQRMYERPIKILSPLTQTEIICNIRMGLSENIPYEVGNFYQFYVFLNHRTPEYAAKVRLNEIFHLADRLYLEISFFLDITPADRILQLASEIQELSIVEYSDLHVMELTFNHILFFSNQIQLHLIKSKVPKDVQNLNNQIMHLCSSSCLDIISYLNFKIEFEQKNQAAQIQKIAFSFVVLDVINIYFLSDDIIQTLDSLLSSLIMLYSLTDTEPKDFRLQANVDSKKQFHAIVYLTDPYEMFYQSYQKNQKFPHLDEDLSDFIENATIWKNKGGELTVTSQDPEQTIFKFSVFAVHFKPQEFILNPDKLPDFLTTLEKIEYQNKRSILLADDGVVNIKFLLKHTLDFLGLGKIPAHSPTSKLDFCKNWLELTCYILSFADWYIICVPNGLCAQNLLSLWQPDAIITDHEMPHLNGTNLIQWFRTEYSEKSHVKIALHSANPVMNDPEILDPLDAIFLSKADQTLFKSFIDSISETKKQHKLTR